MEAREMPEQILKRQGDLLIIGRVPKEMLMDAAAACPRRRILVIDGRSEGAFRERWKGTPVRFKRMSDLGRSDLTGAFDSVLLYKVLHRMSGVNARRLLTRLRRILKADGSLVVMEWRGGGDTGRRLRFLPVKLNLNEQALRFMRRDLYEYFSHSGFYVESLTCTGSEQVLILRGRKAAVKDERERI